MLSKFLSLSILEDSINKQQIVFFLLSAILFSCTEKVDEVVIESVTHPRYNNEDSCENTEFAFDDFEIR